jgi:phospholipase/carboxylesterase
MPTDILIQQPQGTPAQLILLMHGFGANADDLAPIGEHLGTLFPNATVVCLAAPQPADFGGMQGSGLQWFPIQFPRDPRSDEVRFTGVNNALPAFIERVRAWQAKTGVSAEATALFGFSQGGVMALEAAKQTPIVASRIFAHSSRFAMLPDTILPADVTLHLIHGKTDEVITYDHCVNAAERLQALGADFTADVIPFLAHSINNESLGLVSKYLQNHIPKHRWEAAMRASEELASKPNLSKADKHKILVEATIDTFGP